MIPANDNDHVTWSDQLFPVLLGIAVLAVAIRVPLRAFF